MNAKPAPEIDLRILATSDLHGDLLGVDYFSRDPAPASGFARCAGLIRSERASATNSILVDNGDFLQGTPLSDFFYETQAFRDGPHPLIAGMNALGYDAVGLGNHEFTFGLEPLFETLRHAHFPVLCANIQGATQSMDAVWRGRVQPVHILDRALMDTDGTSHCVKIGLFAVLPPAVLNWEATRVGTRLTAQPILKAAREAVATLRDRGADVIVALAHSGLVATGSDGHGENVGADIAALEGIDAVIAGHTHEVFPSPDHPPHTGIDTGTGLVHGVPAVMAGAGGSHLGRIDLRLTRKTDGWDVASVRVQALSVAGQAEDPEAAALAAPFHRRTLDRIDQPVASLPRPVHSYFALLTEDLSTRLVAEAKAAFVRDQLGETEFAGLPVLGSAAPFKSGGPGRRSQFTDVAPGTITQRDIVDMQHYPNDIAALVLTGHQLHEWLDMGAGQYAQVLPGDRDKALILPQFPSYNRDLVSGVTFEIDLAAPPRFSGSGEVLSPRGTRIVNLCYQGRPIAPTDRFVIATNNYRAGGGGHFPSIADAPLALATDVPVRNALATYLEGPRDFCDLARPGWRFAHLPQTSVLFETHPRAMAHLRDVPWLNLSPVAETADVLTLRLSLDADSRLASRANHDYIDA
nr:bifunctional 2',3'-cyclic-nucleotide 2'-phosphodiesterase/3'-nucleotidase [Shimia biformata]